MFTIFNGRSVQPSVLSYRAVTLTASFTLEWPYVQMLTDKSIARIMDVAASGSGLFIRLPPASQATVGENTLISNTGAITFEIQNNGGATVTTIAPGLAKFIYMIDNTSDAGVWVNITYGVGSSSADAASLAGFGLVAIGSKLNTNTPIATYSTNYTVLTTDRAKTMVWTGGAGTFSFSSVGILTNGFYVLVSNQGTGSLVLDPDGGELIDNLSTLSLSPGYSCIVACSGTTLYTVGRQLQVPASASSYLQKNVAGATDVTLTAAEASNRQHRYFGALTGNINVIVPATVAEYFTFNNTSGAFSLTIKTAAGLGVTLPQGQHVIVKCDGTDVLDADTVTPPGAFSIPDGNVGTPGLAFTNDADTGIYRPGAGIFAITTDANERWQVSSASMTTTVPSYAPDGTLAAPSLTFTADTNTGLWRPGNETIELVGAGRAILRGLGNATAVNYARISAALVTAETIIEGFGTQGDLVTGDGTDIALQGGRGGSTSGHGGDVIVRGGVPVAGDGGEVFIEGEDGVGTNKNGGNLFINAGLPTGTGIAGSISITAANLAGAGSGGLIGLVAGNGNGATSGGKITAKSGNGGTTAPGADIELNGGDGGSTSGGAGKVKLGGGTPVDGNGGNIELTASNGVGTNRSGGNLLLNTGTATGTGIHGIITTTGGAHNAPVSITYAATITLDLALANNFETTLTGNVTMANPTNVVSGQVGHIKITQDATGGRTISFGTNWKFAGGQTPVLSPTANAIDILVYYVYSGALITGSLIEDIK